MTIDGIERENQPAGMSFDERFLASVVVCRRVPPRIPVSAWKSAFGLPIEETFLVSSPIKIYFSTDRFDNFSLYE